jgi:N-acetylmuramoyl-L-alanine amidase
LTATHGRNYLKKSSFFAASIDQKIAHFSSRNERVPRSNPHASAKKPKEPCVRIQRLLFLFAYLCSSAATPAFAALGEASRCVTTEQGTLELTDVNLPLPAFGKAMPNLDPKDRDYMIRTIAFEASGEPEEGKSAVAHVILNRTLSGRWGDNIKDVVTHPWQFEPWMTRRKEMQNMSPSDPRYLSAARIADQVLAGETPDPTAGATHFLNPTIVRQRRGGSLPAWAEGSPGHPIGRHTFYAPREGNSTLHAALLDWQTDSILGLSRGPWLVQARHEESQPCR